MWQGRCATQIWAMQVLTLRLLCGPNRVELRGYRAAGALDVLIVLLLPCTLSFVCVPARSGPGGSGSNRDFFECILGAQEKSLLTCLTLMSRHLWASSFLPRASRHSLLTVL